MGIARRKTRTLLQATSFALLTLLLAPQACEKPRAEPRSPEAARPSEAPDAATTEDAESSIRDADADAAGDARDASTRPEPVTSNPARFGCGNVTCRVGAETCCAYEREGVCLPSSPDDGPKGSIGYLKTQWEACGKITFPSSSAFNHMDRCDESIDCPDKELCCNQFLFSGGEMGECTAPLKSGQTPCDFGELCLEGSPCRDAGTVCIDGYCQRPRTKLRCGGAICPDGFACIENRDCLPGQRCVVAGVATMCMRLVFDPENTHYVCKRDADCPNKCTSTPGAKPRCVETGIDFIKQCECP